MADILAQSLADLATARTAVLEEMKNRYPVGSEVSWRAGKGFSTGLVIGHAPFWTREPTRLWVKSIRNGKTKWVTPYNLPSPSYAAQPAQAVDLERFRGTVKSQYSMTEWMHRCGFVSAKKLEESKKNHDHLMALIDSQAVGNG